MDNIKTISSISINKKLILNKGDQNKNGHLSSLNNPKYYLVFLSLLIKGDRKKTKRRR